MVRIWKKDNAAEHARIGRKAIPLSTMSGSSSPCSDKGPRLVVVVAAQRHQQRTFCRRPRMRNMLDERGVGLSRVERTHRLCWQRNATQRGGKRVWRG